MYSAWVIEYLNNKNNTCLLCLCLHLRLAKQDGRKVTFRVLFGGEDDARKVTIESAIPRTVEDLALKLNTFFQVKVSSSDFGTKTKTWMISSWIFCQHQNLKIKVKVKVSGVHTYDTTRSTPLQEMPAAQFQVLLPMPVQQASQEPCDSDTSNDTIILSSSPETRSCSWPKTFAVPRFSSCAEIMLQTENDEFKALRTCRSPTPKVRSDIVEGLFEEISSTQLTRGISS